MFVQWSICTRLRRLLRQEGFDRNDVLQTNDPHVFSQRGSRFGRENA